LLFVAAYIFREPLLRSFATALIQEDALEKADAIIVLSGGSLDRGNEAVRLYSSGISKNIICPGANKVRELEILDMDITESVFTKMNLLKQGVPATAITVIEVGTSTKEEAEVVFPICVQRKYKTVLLLTSKFHTRRAGNVFRQKFESSGIRVIVHGAASSRYDEYRWWKSEDGLISMNNEWLKQLYYWLK
jgi:uncharacterized SAM-binding protein YcdF (DUF218 family)